MRFVAVDVETANADLASICQIGIALFEGGRLAEAWGTLIDPEDDFDPFNVAIHGITESSVRGAPTFPSAFDAIVPRLNSSITVSHTPFDRLALSRAAERYNLPEVAVTWLDSARVVRRAWPQWAQSGYGLANVALKLGISYKAHDAVEDARAAGEILLKAVQETGHQVEDWLKRVQFPIGADGKSQITRVGNPEGSLFGEVAVFTGALSMPRREAADLAASAGCTVASSVNSRTTLLVVGDQDLRRLEGHEKSAKHRKADDLIANGQSIRVLGESDFRRLVG